MDYSTLAAEYSKLTVEEKSHVDRLVSENKSEDFYLGMLEGLFRATQLIQDPTNKRSVALISTRAAYLYKTTFPNNS